VAIAGAEVVDAEVHGGAIKPAGEVEASCRRESGGVQLQKSFISNFFGSSGIAEHAAKKIDKARIVGKEELFEAFGGE
jgi:hypothetical protein